MMLTIAMLDHNFTLAGYEIDAKVAAELIITKASPFPDRLYKI